jgi:hypothetical protein
MSDKLAEEARNEFEDAGHLVSYLCRMCPTDGMGCGACPKTGCDQHEFSGLIFNITPHIGPFPFGPTSTIQQQTAKEGR